MSNKPNEIRESKNKLKINLKKFAQSKYGCIFVPEIKLNTKTIEIMKSIYVAQLSEDGLDKQVYSNIKSLYNGVLETGYKCETIRYINDSVKFNYSNLVKMVKKSQNDGRYYANVYIENESEYGTIHINELPIKSN